MHHLHPARASVAAHALHIDTADTAPPPLPLEDMMFDRNDGHNERGYDGDCEYSRAEAERMRPIRLRRLIAMMQPVLDEVMAGVGDDSILVSEGVEFKALAEMLLEASDELPEEMQ